MSDQEDQDERRKYKRLDTLVSVNISYYKKKERATETGESQSRNLSACGLLVRFDRPLEVSSFVLVQFTLPSGGEPIELVAKVVRTEEIVAGELYEIGLAFINYLLDDIEQIDVFIQEKLPE